MYIVFDRNKVYLCDDHGTKLYKYNKKQIVNNRHSFSLAMKDVFASKKHFFYNKVDNSDILDTYQYVISDSQCDIKDGTSEDVLNSLLFKFYPLYFKSSNIWYIIALTDRFSDSNYVYLCRGDDTICSGVCKFTHDDCKTTSIVFSKNQRGIVITRIKNGKLRDWTYGSEDQVRWITIGDELRYNGQVVDINYDPQLVDIMVRSKYKYLFDWVNKHHTD